MLGYFAAQVVYDVVLLAAGFDLDSRRYAVLFTVLTSVILIASAGYTSASLLTESRRVLWLATVESIFLPVFILCVSVSALGEYLPFLPRGTKIALGEGTALLAVAIGLGTAALFMPKHSPARCLAPTWFALSLWEYAYAYGEPFARATLWSLNEWVPALIICAGFAATAIWARVPGELKFSPVHKATA